MPSADHGLILWCLEEPRAFWRPFKTDELGRFEKKIRYSKPEVDEEIYRALRQSISQEQQLQLIDRKATGLARAFLVFGLANQMKNNEGEWYKQMNARLVRDSHSIHLSCQKFRREIESRKQELLDRLSKYDAITLLRRASLKRHGKTASWLTESAEFVNWMADLKSNMFTLSGKHESLSKINAQFID